MKWTYFIALSAVALFNANLYALDVTDAKVISYKEWVAGNIQGKMRIIPLQAKARNLNQLKTAKAEPDTNALVKIADHLNPEQINANNTLNMNGDQDVRIYNHQPAAHRYTITTRFCLCEQYEGDEPPCYNAEEVLQLAPNSVAYIERQPSIVYIMPKRGYYFSAIETTVKRDDLSTVFVSGDFRQFEASIPDEG